MSNNSDEKKITVADNGQPDNNAISRRTALKLFGAGAVGAIGAAYGINQLTGNQIDEATAMSLNTNSKVSDASASPQPLNTTTPVMYTDNQPMKVVLINGSPRRNGNTFICLTEIANILEAEGVKTTLIQLGSKPVQGCNNCQACRKTGACIFNDPLYAEAKKELEDADGLIIGSPVYYAGPNGALCALIDRLFYSASGMLTHKVGAAVAVCRRGGASATLDRLNKYFSISNMNIVGSQYWNMAHGAAPGEVKQDEEGLQIMRTLGRNMAWSIRNTRMAQQPLPERESRIGTNFIR